MLAQSGQIIRARAPLRLGLAGGGSDVSPFCDEHGGCVLNAAIDRYAFASIEPAAKGEVNFDATDLEYRDACITPDGARRLDDSQGLRLHRGVYNRMCALYCDGEWPSIRLTTFVESPMGSGLGSSSALVVTMVQAFATYLGAPLGEYEVARLAFDIERRDLGLSGGRQDQYAAAFGGVNFMEFGAADHVIVNPLRLRSSMLHELEAGIILLFTGASRSSSEVIDTQSKALQSGGASLEAMHQLKREAVAMKEALLFGGLTDVAEVLERGWQAKKATSSAVSTPEIEAALAQAMSDGAYAGKVSGAGGGGFIMFIAPPERRAQIMRSLESGRHGQCMTARFVDDGALAWRAPTPSLATTRRPTH
jgi:D-glycero-alpha-D-manno-heptose-7-phosphate kinase